MALDHYIPQVYLKRFYSHKIELLNAFGKINNKYFTPNSKSVCRIDENSTNKYLNDERIIEEFLKQIEPKYNYAVNKLLGKEIGKNCIFIISGLVSYIITCSPTAMRMNSVPLKETLINFAYYLDKNNQFPEYPGGKNITFTELLKEGKLTIDVDKKYSQAMGISDIYSHVITNGNFFWEILINRFQENPFFTSDFPIAYEGEKRTGVKNKIVPLDPYLAIRIIPNIEVEEKLYDNNFTFFKYRYLYPNLKEIQNINKIIVRSAENIVFFKENYDWVLPFIKKNSNYYTKSKTDIITKGDKSIVISNYYISKREEL